MLREYSGFFYDFFPCSHLARDLLVMGHLWGNLDVCSPLILSPFQDNIHLTHIDKTETWNSEPIVKPATIYCMQTLQSDGNSMNNDNFVIVENF